VNIERVRLPRLYTVIDADRIASTVPAERLTSSICDFASELAAGGVTLMQYRAARLSSREMLSHTRELRRVLGPEITLLMNDRSDLCLAAGFDGVHLGENDLSPTAARAVLGNRHWVGFSTHTIEQIRKADESEADYIGIEAFGSESKGNPGSIAGLEEVRAVRRLTSKPLVAIGGVTRTNARAMIEAGADAVAVFEDLFEQPKRSAEEFLAILV
jgi:thiamine-phosphate pyrophosphorylase